MTEIECELGQIVQTQDGREGTVRYKGGLHITAGDWLGLELADDSGKNDGSVKGERYFQCQAGHGIFVRKESIIKIVQDASPQARANGSTPNGRPVNGITAEMARKRQSLMGASAGAPKGPRLSMRSPTKSPTKAVQSSANSTNSASRSGTPATTVRTSDSSTKSRPSAGGRLSMAPPPRAHASRTSISSITNRAPSKAAATTSRTSTAGSRLSLQSRTAPRQSLSESETRPDSLSEGPHGAEDAATGDDQPGDVTQASNDDDTNLRPEPLAQQELADETSLQKHDQESESRSSDHMRRASASKVAINATMEARVAQQKEVEQLKAKIRTLEKKRIEDRDKLKNVETIQGEKDKLENVVQALQRKLKTNLQEMNELKAKYEEVEKNAGQVNDRSAEHESELELATLDKEMAEERADQLQVDLDTLRIKHEEMELETEVLREENKELSAVMSPEEKATAGWLQMERETERLRQALVLLRDMSQQSESDLKAQVKELQDNMEQAQKVASRYDETVERLAKAEATNEHLMEQLEAADTNEEIVEAMEAQREQQTQVIEQLRNQVQELEEHIQVADELELFRVDEERRLHSQLDDTEALVTEQQQQSIQQERVIEDMEYTLTKFRDVVQGLQSDIDELRRSRKVNEVQAQEMHNKSRAMMELNLQLQSSATKTKMKAIDLEVGKMRAQEAIQHLEIVQLFLPDSYSEERNPVLALLAFQRLRSQAMLVKSLLTDRMRDRPQLSQDDPFAVYSVIEKSSLIGAYCEESVQFMYNCTKAEFSRFAGAPYELEPIERALTGWINALRKDELSRDGAEHLQRMIGILTDLTDKLVPDSATTQFAKIVRHGTTIETYAESAANNLAVLVKTVQASLGRPQDDDQESVLFDKKMDQLGTRARTIRYISGKVNQALLELHLRSMCLPESSWLAFEEAERVAGRAADTIRDIGMCIFEDMAKLERDTPLTYTSVIEQMTSFVAKYEVQSDSKAGEYDDIFGYLTGKLQSLQARVDDLSVRAADIHSAIVFEKRPYPWTIRAKELKAQRIISEDVQEELSRLKRQAQEQQARLGDKDKQLEEQQIKVELLTSRSKDTKMKEETLKAMEEELDELRTGKDRSTKDLETLQSEHAALVKLNEKHKSELANLKTIESNTTSESSDADTFFLQAQIAQLNAEMASLQSAIRYLKSENLSLRIPITEAALRSARHSWLDPKSLSANRPVGNSKTETLRTESKDVFTELIGLAKAAKPVVLSRPEVGEKRSARWKTHDDLRYQLFRQKEDLERWCGWRDDLVERAQLASSRRLVKRNDAELLPLSSGTKGADGSGGEDRGPEIGNVEIMPNSP